MSRAPGRERARAADPRQDETDTANVSGLVLTRGGGPRRAALLSEATTAERRRIHPWMEKSDSGSIGVRLPATVFTAAAWRAGQTVCFMVLRTARVKWGASK